MPNFTCTKCGFGSLVRSNFKLTPDRKPYCRAEDKCAARRRQQKPVEDDDNQSDWYALSNGLGTVMPDGTRVGPAEE